MARKKFRRAPAGGRTRSSLPLCASRVEWLRPIPGVMRRTAEVIVAEVGLDMSQFPSAARNLGHGALLFTSCGPLGTSSPAESSARGPT